MYSIHNEGKSIVAETSALTAVQNLIPNVSNLVKKSDYDTKLLKLKREWLITSIRNILLLQNLNFAARLAQANVVTKTDFDNKLTSFNKTITSNKT